MSKSGVFFVAKVLVLLKLILLASSFSIHTKNDGNSWAKSNTNCENGCEKIDLRQNRSVNSENVSAVEDDLETVAPIQRNCGADDICIPSLKLHVEQSEQYIYEVDKPLVFHIDIQNLGEDAYDANFYLHLPDDFGFKGAKNTNEQLPYTGSCKHSENKSVVVCDIGDPFISSDKIKFDVIMVPLKGQKDMQKTYDFYMNVTGLNDSWPGSWNQWTARSNLTVYIFANYNLKIKGQSTPEDVYYNTSLYENAEGVKLDSEVGPLVNHLYTFVNYGPSDVEDVNVLMSLPFETLNGDGLLYLTEQPDLVGDIRCEAEDDFGNHTSYVAMAPKEEPLFNDERMKSFLNAASNARLYLIRCKIESIQKGQEVKIALRLGINVTTVENISKTQPINIKSILLADTLDSGGLLYSDAIMTRVMNIDTDYKTSKKSEIIIPLYI